ncbi:hypothetical protein RB6193 [Rhodopirellula baltica SH 1]|uniref:Uncharacterized protein n=1 Tax=Rhodopirellula baltica (strain DSM 10527 / NCIMB 13988 / SH1) TaxID=243090 RepID=Q7UQP1_RHOBA|nr:hypothetical protein RB6193 [Rhodopirellula baltica SH 1]
MANGQHQPQSKRVEFGRWPNESMVFPVPGTLSQATLKKVVGHQPPTSPPPFQSHHRHRETPP